jgi:hypothetical protein
MRLLTPLRSSANLKSNMKANMHVYVFACVCSFTLEASFAGPSKGRWAGQHFSTMHLELMGASLLSALADMWDPEQYGTCCETHTHTQHTQRGLC